MLARRKTLKYYKEKWRLSAPKVSSLSIKEIEIFLYVYATQSGISLIKQRESFTITMKVHGLRRLDVKYTHPVHWFQAWPLAEI